MAITFNGFGIPGQHGALQKGLREIHASRTHFAGVYGDSEITEGPGCREITCHIWINDSSFSSSGALAGFLESMDLIVLTNGDLVESGTISETLKDCTFEGFDPHPDGMRPGSGTIDPATWWIEGVLRWRQLSGF